MSFGSIWKRYGCCDGPINKMNGIKTIFVLQSFNYRTIPQWFTNKRDAIIPIQFEVDANSMIYKYSFSDNLCDTELYLRTSDDIFPIIRELISQKIMNVERCNVINGYTTWRVTC